MDGDAINAVNACLPDLKQMVIDEPIVGEMARIGIVIFNDTADTAMPLTDLAEVEMPQFTATGATSYQAALEETRAFIEQSIRRLGSGVQYYTPIVFFLSDGAPLDPEEAWLAAAQSLKSNGKYGANVVCFGFGGADPELLCKIGRTFLFRESDPILAVKEIFQKLEWSIRTTSMSAAAGGLAGIQFPEDITKNAELFIEMDVQHA
jgi:uncharacterized protein YegL